MSDLEFAYAVARIRVREKSLLSDTDISQMVGLKDQKSVLSFLMDKGWGDSDTGSDPEAVLMAEEEKTLQLMKELKIDPAIFDLLSYPQIYHNLKAGIKEVMDPDINERAFYDHDRYGRDAMVRILSEKDYAALPDHMRAAAERAYEIMLKTHDGQMCDVIVDRACLDAMEAAGQKSKSPLLRDYEESTVAVTDIKIAVRAVRTGKSLDFLKEALAPCRSLDVRQIAYAAAESEETLLTYLEDHGMKEAAEALKESSSAFERWCDNRLIETIRPERTNPFSAGPVIAYYLARQNEIKMARIILTAKANNFSEDVIQERVRKMYG